MSRLDASQRRRQLVDAGLALVATLPLDQISADNVARSAGVSKGLVFHYFPTTAALHAALVRERIAALLAELAVDRRLPAVERLRAGLQAFVHHIESQPANVAALVRSAGAADEELLAVFEEARQAVVELMLDALGAHGPADRLRLVLRAVIAMIEDTVLHWVAVRGVSREELLGFLERTTLAMLQDPFAREPRAGRRRQMEP